MNRIAELDALRGFALLGILLVNVFVFHAPICYYGEFYGAFEGTEGLAVNTVVNFAGGKFMFIFAFLFGYGIVLQEKSQQEGFKSYFLKRMTVLLVFGLLHILLFWFGDILASYALLGFLIFPLLRLSNKRMLFTAIAFIMFRSLYYFAAFHFDLSTIPIEKPATLDYFMNTYQEGTYTSIFSLRMDEFISFIPENLVWYFPKTFGLFLLGVYAARKDFFASLKRNDTSYLITALLFMLVSTIWIFYKSEFFGMFDLEKEPYWRAPLIAINVVFETLLGLSYIIGFSMLFQKTAFLRKLFAKAGRLALSNYIMQSLLAVLIFYGYGLGYYAKLKPTDLILITIAIFSINLIFSHIYLKYRKLGPLEYLWRKLIK